MSSSVSSREQYDQLWAGAWGDMQRFGPVHRHQREHLLRLIRKLNVRTILDVGCGAGDNLASIAQMMPHLTLSGADVSAEALALAAKRASGLTLYQLDVQREALKDRFDLVMSIQVIEHLTDDVSALRNMGLMSNEWILITTVRGRMRSSERDIGHVRNYSDGELRTKAASAGLRVHEIFGWGFPFYSPLYRTIAEWLPGGPPKGKISPRKKIAADALYWLYHLNIPRCGDVVTMLCAPANVQSGRKDSW